VKDPAFLFYPEAYMMGTLGMTYDQKGRYVDLLCIQHQKGHIDADMFSQVLNGCLDGVVGKKFAIDDNGCYYNQRLEAEIIKRKEYTAGRLKNFAGSSHMDVDMDTHMEGTMGDHMEAHTKDINKDIDTELKKETKATRKRFTPPSLADVSAYCKERGNKVDAETFIDFYTAKDWKIGNNKMKDWKACVRTWEKRDNYGGKPNTRKGKTVIEQQYTQRDYDAKDYDGLTPEEIEEALKYDA
jgi:coenzyme F420-reducing hydrogenase delta subunit